MLVKLRTKRRDVQVHNKDRVIVYNALSLGSYSKIIQSTNTVAEKVSSDRVKVRL